MCKIIVSLQQRVVVLPVLQVLDELPLLPLLDLLVELPHLALLPANDFPLKPKLFN